jgi:Endoplasmic Reticulum-Golgi Intermediate Compartment (ERGIC)
MKEDLVVDRSPQGELLRINFNISFPSLSCEFATLDVSDSLGTVRALKNALLEAMV